MPTVLLCVPCARIRDQHIGLLKHQQTFIDFTEKKRKMALFLRFSKKKNVFYEKVNVSKVKGPNNHICVFGDIGCHLRPLLRIVIVFWARSWLSRQVSSCMPDTDPEDPNRVKSSAKRSSFLGDISGTKATKRLILVCKEMRDGAEYKNNKLEGWEDIYKKFQAFYWAHAFDTITFQRHTQHLFVKQLSWLELNCGLI